MRADTVEIAHGVDESFSADHARIKEDNKKKNEEYFQSFREENDSISICHDQLIFFFDIV